MTVQPRPLNVAMIGVGDITDLHYPAYVDFDQAVLHTICDASESALARRSAQWGVKHKATDYRQVLVDPDIDLVEVNLPHHLHKEVVVAALGAGKHVACQKPIATTIADAKAMVTAAEKSRGSFRVLENFVFYPPYEKARELILAGEIGDPLTIRFKLGTGLFGSRWIPLKSELWHLRESEKGMGQAVFDDGYHKLSMAMHYFGPVASVMGFIGRSFNYIDEPAQLMWRYKDNQVLGSFDNAFSPNLYTFSKYFPADERIEVVGTRGMIFLSQCTGQIMDAPPLILYRDGKSVLFEDLETDWQASFTAGIRDFPAAICEGRQTLISGKRALEILQMAFALIIAAQKGVEVRPDEVSDDMIAETLGKTKPDTTP
ncbi:MAG: Gfo/Idh/MocA family oxidoreductase [Desulfobacterales bacterium]|nr:Gfo/Idh/MocA family oxidoreductase [Desulfobacterales bacterium]